MKTLFLAGVIGWICLVSLFVPQHAFAGAVPKAALLKGDACVARGAAAAARGKAADALAWFQKAADAYGRGGDRRQRIDALLRLCGTLVTTGRHAEAVARLNALLEREQLEAAQRCALLGTLGLAHHSAGEPGKALAILQEGLEGAQTCRRDNEAAAILNTMGMVHAAAGRWRDAAEAFDASLRKASPGGAHGLRVKVLINDARMSLRWGRTSRAADRLQRADAEMRHLGKSRDTSYALIAAGLLYRELGREAGGATPPAAAAPRRAWDCFKSAESIARDLDDTVALSYALGHRGRLYEDAGREEEALRLTRLAVFYAQQAASHESLFLWQWQTGRLLTARHHIDDAVMAYDRAITSLDAFRGDLSRACGGEGRPSFREAVGPLYFELADLLLRRGALGDDPAKRRQDLLRARETVEGLKTVEMQDYYRDECVTALRSGMTELEQIGKATAALYPILLPDRIALLLTFRGGVRQTVVSVEATEVTAEIRRLRTRLERPGSRYRRHAKRLYDWLIAPVAAELETRRVDTLIVIPDGPLRTIPFSALYDGNAFLVERFAVATSPGLTLTDPHPIPRDNLELLVSGLTEGVQGFPPLPHIDAEMAQLQQLFPCDLLQNRAFSRNNLEAALRRTPYPVVHIASHAQFDSDPGQTFLLTYTEKLDMADLERVMAVGRYRKTPVELLTLSACQTAAGDDRAALGLAGVALRAGARSALATLWHIDDAATAALVNAFYRGLQDAAVTKAQALQQAQIALIGGRYGHPAYWAPFLLIGNWL